VPRSAPARALRWAPATAPTLGACEGTALGARERTALGACDGTHAGSLRRHCAGSLRAHCAGSLRAHCAGSLRAHCAGSLRAHCAGSLRAHCAGSLRKAATGAELSLTFLRSSSSSSSRRRPFSTRCSCLRRAASSWRCCSSRSRSSLNPRWTPTLGNIYSIDGRKKASKQTAGTSKAWSQGWVLLLNILFVKVKRLRGSCFRNVLEILVIKRSKRIQNLNLPLLLSRLHRLHIPQ
jgi:hypothetical protein